MRSIVEALAPGSTFRNLQIERELGRGGFATVYLARDTRLGRQVALKVLSGPGMREGGDAEVLGFMDEARLIARLHSPHVVTLFQLHEVSGDDADRGPGALVLEMELVPGGTLGDAAAAGGMSLEQVEACVRGTLAGLSAAHEGGVLHRDIKPANILLAASGDAKLTDFGLGRMIAEDIDLDDGGIGTPLYMAPELFVGGSASRQSDLWSVGVVTYELLSGRLPFPRDNAAAFFAAVQNEDPSPLPVQVPSHLRALVAGCLGKDPERRPASCEEALALLDHPPAPAPVAARPTAAPTIRGRASELARFEDALAAPSGGPNTLVLTGPAGVGKTALLGEAAQRARTAAHFWIDARLSPIEGPLHTLVDAVRDATLAVTDPKTAGFGPGGAGLKRILHGEELPPLDSPQQALSTLQRLLSGVAMARPLVLCVDDAQHASAEDVALLADLARWFGDRPFLLVVATRPGTVAAGGFEAAHRLDLGGVTGETLFALLEDALAATVPAEVAARVFERTDGNPLHAIELVRHLEAAGALVRRDGSLDTTSGWRQSPVPGRLRDVVHARLAALDEADRALLEAAAVDGREFDGRAVAAVLDLPLLQVLRRLQGLCRDRTLIAPAPRGYHFADLAAQEVLYEDMAPELARELHAALAHHLEGRDDAIEPDRIARHWERCGERARAAPYLVRVAKRANDRQEAARFVDLAERAGMLEDPPLVDPRAEVGLFLSLAQTLTRTGRAEEGEALFARLSRLATEAGDEELLATVDIRRALGCLSVGQRPEAGAAHWHARADRLGTTIDSGHARSIAGRLAKLDGDFDAARHAFEQADQVFQALGNGWFHSVMLDQLGSVSMRAGQFDDARALYAEAGEVAERSGVASNAAVSRTNAALAAMLAGNIEGMDRELMRSIRTFDLSGAFGTAAHTRLYLAEVLFAHGKTGAALEVLDLALGALGRADHHIALANAWRMRAELLAVQGRLAEAAEAIASALEFAASGGDRTQVLVARAVEAMVANAQDRPDDAARAVEEIRAAGQERAARAEGAVLILCEAVLFGMPPATLEAIRHIAHSDLERSLLDISQRLAAGRACDEPLRLLEAQTIGLRRASYRLLTDWLAAEAALRAGDRQEARKRAAAAIETAVTLGHTRAEARLRALPA